MILVSFSLLTLTIGAVMYMHGFYKGETLLSIGFLLTLSGMMFWFRDVIIEGIKKIIIAIIIFLIILGYDLSYFELLNNYSLLYLKPIQLLPSGISKIEKCYSNQSNITNSVINNNIQKINPWFITGLTDGDGSFYISITKKSKNLVGWEIQIYFTIVTSINPPNLNMLKHINNYFGNIGRISLKATTYHLTFSGVTNCLIIKTHFDLFPLMSYKLVHY